MISDGMLSSETPEWATPQSFFDELNKEFGFTLDVCAAAWNHKCERYFDKDTDGLLQDWTKDVCWMNPPYGRDIGNWMRKALEESLYGATVVCLVPARTDTAWWHDYAMKGEIRFLRGRIQFVSQDQNKINPAPFPSAIVIFRSEAVIKALSNNLQLDEISQ